MPTLKETKGRINSVRNTLKITSAMKLVASAKLRKAQQAIESMRPYERQLQRMLEVVCGRHEAEALVSQVESLKGRKAVVAIASNSAMCGSFNANVIAKVRSLRSPGDTVWSIGRKMADAMRRDGFPSPDDLSAVAEHPAYAPVASLVEKLSDEFEKGRYSCVVLVYNHFVSTARQVPVVEVLLAEDPSPAAPVQDDKASVILSGSEESLIIEPSRKELLEALVPKTRKLKLYAALLDSSAAEQAARTVAMQTATDNGEDLLEDLTLQYNKGRQQKITSEILDLAGGQTEHQ